MARALAEGVMSADRHNGRASKGARPAPITVDEILARDDADLGSLLVGIMCNEPRWSNFAALGRLVRAGSREDLVEALRRPGRHERRRAPDGPGDGDEKWIGELDEVLP